MRSRNKFLITQHVLFHAGMFPSNWTVCYTLISCGSLYFSRGTWGYCAVNNGYSWFVFRDIACRGANKVADLKWIANMKNGAGHIDIHWIYINAHAVIGPGEDAQERAADLS
jgi:hypothetical protein